MYGYRQLVKDVALRKESVDRNAGSQNRNTGRVPVALRKESVDRNALYWALRCLRLSSLSARRAWIEICRMAAPGGLHSPVALRKESVDRNSMA